MWQINQRLKNKSQTGLSKNFERSVKLRRFYVSSVKHYSQQGCFSFKGTFVLFSLSRLRHSLVSCLHKLWRQTIWERLMLRTMVEILQEFFQWNTSSVHLLISPRVALALFTIQKYLFCTYPLSMISSLLATLTQKWCFYLLLKISLHFQFILSRFH